MKRNYFKEPLCLKCDYFVRMVSEDGEVYIKCNSGDGIPITPARLAVECNQFYDRIKNKFHSQLAEIGWEIPIIGSDKKIKGFRRNNWED